MTIQAGLPVEFKTLSPITREQLKEYALASGDHNPIHLDEEVARKVGLPGIIAHGMFVAAQIGERAKTFVHGEAQLSHYRFVKFQSRFKAMTLLGDSLSIGGLVKDFNEQEVVLDLQAKNQRGEVTTLGIIRFLNSSIE